MRLRDGLRHGVGFMMWLGVLCGGFNDTTIDMGKGINL